jgi:hypothetical protein
VTENKQKGLAPKLNLTIVAVPPDEAGLQKPKGERAQQASVGLLEDEEMIFERLFG